MNKITSFTRKDQTKRRHDVYALYKKLINSTKNDNLKKECIYQEVAKKYNYNNVTSVKSIIRQLREEEAEKNNVNLNKAKGILETIIAYEDLNVSNFDSKNLDLDFDLKIAEFSNTILIEGSFNSGSNDNTRKDFFDHFSIDDIPSSINRITNLLHECYSIYLNTNN